MKPVRRWSTLSALIAALYTAILLPAAGVRAVDTQSNALCLVHSVESERHAALTLLSARKAGVAYPDIPSVEQMSLVSKPPITGWDRTLPLSAGLSDPLLEQARELKAFDDFKPLSDLVPKKLTPTQISAAKTNAERLAAKVKDPTERERLYVRALIEALYEHPQELLPAQGEIAAPRFTIQTSDPKIKAAFDYTEATWSKLLKEPHPVKGGSLLGSPYPVLVPAGRFQESYYWDTYFGIKGLLSTGRLEIAQMQVENFLSWVQKYGFVPNGGRDYYLSRSQPPFLSSMVREVYEASLKAAEKMPGANIGAEKARLALWLKTRAYPLVERDYQNFWMNPKTRLDAGTGLNHNWNDVNIPRPERHSADNELELGKTYRDTSAGAEEGTDFMVAQAREASRIANPLLNSMLYKTETDLEWMASLTGDSTGAARFAAAAKSRQDAMTRDLWNPDPKNGYFEHYHLGTQTRINVLTAETAAPLFAGLASPEQARQIRNVIVGQLEKPGGIMSSNVMNSPHQWDGSNGFAAFQAMTIEGLLKYGYVGDARRIAREWVDANAQIHHDDGVMVERVDVVTRSRPVTDAHKYPTQEGFLWTNGSFVWSAVDVLGYRLVPNFKAKL